MSDMEKHSSLFCIGDEDKIFFKLVQYLRVRPEPSRSLITNIIHTEENLVKDKRSSLLLSTVGDDEETFCDVATVSSH